LNFHGKSENLALGAWMTCQRIGCVQRVLSVATILAKLHDFGAGKMSFAILQYRVRFSAANVPARRIVGKFEKLNPYNPKIVPGSILNIVEEMNFD
jgi:hypothetical protein